MRASDKIHAMEEIGLRFCKRIVPTKSAKYTDHITNKILCQCTESHVIIDLLKKKS